MWAFQISDLREHQHCGAIIADRVWNAWWKDAELPLADVERHISEMADERPLPMAIVGHNERGYVGSAFLVHSDMKERPQYRPWVEAVWVEAAERKRGAGPALIAEAAKTARILGHQVVYICCRPELESFYSRIGCEIVEKAVGANSLTVLKLDLRAPPSKKRRGRATSPGD